MIKFVMWLFTANKNWVRNRKREELYYGLNFIKLSSHLFNIFQLLFGPSCFVNKMEHFLYSYLTTIVMRKLYNAGLNKDKICFTVNMFLGSAKHAPTGLSLSVVRPSVVRPRFVQIWEYSLLRHSVIFSIKTLIFKLRLGASIGRIVCRSVTQHHASKPL